MGLTEIWLRVEIPKRSAGARDVPGKRMYQMAKSSTVAVCDPVGKKGGRNEPIEWWGRDNGKASDEGVRT